MRVTAQTKSATRQRILEVAKKQFASQGFEATTTRDIASGSGLGVGTLFNYFPTKESIVECLVGEAWTKAAAEFAASTTAQADEPPSLEEALFAQVAAIFRKLKPYRKYLPAVLETTLSPLSDNAGQAGRPSLRAEHLDLVGQLIAQHGHHDALTAVALQLYWTLYTGVLAFWAQDRSPRQEDTLALLDQSLAMFVGWLTGPSNCPAHDSPISEG